MEPKKAKAQFEMLAKKNEAQNQWAQKNWS
jgi:hypothetical protein